MLTKYEPLASVPRAVDDGRQDAKSIVSIGQQG